MKKNYYEILEIDKNATPQEVESSYLEAKETYSPTSAALYSMFSSEEANELHKLIEEAYKVLSNRDLRKSYDANLDQSETRRPLSVNRQEESSEKESLSEKTYLENGVLITSFAPESGMEEKIKDLNDCSGAFLQRVRKYKNISLDELSSYSKISKTNLLALEEEDFENLPAKVFTRGFVLQVSRLLGLDANTFTKEYSKLIDGYNQKK